MLSKLPGNYKRAPNMDKRKNEIYIYRRNAHTRRRDEVKSVITTTTRQRILLSVFVHRVAFQARGVSFFGMTLARASFPCHYTLPQNTRTYIRTRNKHPHPRHTQYPPTRTKHLRSYVCVCTHKVRMHYTWVYVLVGVPRICIAYVAKYIRIK